MSQDLILFLAANPSSTSRLALDMECAAIDRELRMAGNGTAMGFAAKWAVTADEMMRHLVELQPAIIHFSGHGTSAEHVDPWTTLRDVAAPDDRRGGICLQGEGGSAQLVDGRTLTRMIKSTASSARLVVLNACYSEPQAAAVSSVVDCVVGMTGAIDDAAARSFAVAFYRALCNGRSVGNALDQATALLAAKHPAFEHLPCCRMRSGIDIHSVVVTRAGRPASVAPVEAAVTAQQWAQRFDALVTLCQEAHEKLDSDPLGAALRVQLAIEHITDYLHEQELGPAEPGDTPDAKLQRIMAKPVIPPIIATYFGSVQAQITSMIHVARMAQGPQAGFLGPCLGSLAIVVEWFFWDYLGRFEQTFDRGALEWQVSSARPDPSETPPSTIGTLPNTTTLVGIGAGNFNPIWRSDPTASTLRLDAAEGNGSDQRVFRIEDPGRTYRIGRTEIRSDGTSNDFVVPRAWSSVSRGHGTLATRDGSVVLVNTSRHNNVFVSGEVVPSGCARGLRHGDVVQLGWCVGAFFDGRYYATAPLAAVDRRTGLLSRQGLIAEIGGLVDAQQSRVLFVLHCYGDDAARSANGRSRDPERLAAEAAIAIHRRDPSWPVARIEMNVAVLLPSPEAVREAVAAAEGAIGSDFATGVATLTGPADQAILRLESCLSALSRMPIDGPEDATVPDLGSLGERAAMLARDVPAGRTEAARGSTRRRRR